MLAFLASDGGYLQAPLVNMHCVMCWIWSDGLEIRSWLWVCFSDQRVSLLQVFLAWGFRSSRGFATVAIMVEWLSWPGGVGYAW